MSESDAVRALARAAWARSLLLAVSSCVCLIMFAAYAGGLPDASSRGLDLINSALGVQFWAWCFGLAGVGGLVVAGAGTRGRWLILTQGSLYGFWGMCNLLSWVIFGGRGYVAAAPWVLCELLLLVLFLLPARRP